jgi:undecaprenyl-diphosphatase
MLVLNIQLASLWQVLNKLDHQFFRLINEQWSFSFLDLIFPFLREAEFWLPLYLFLIVFATLNFGVKGWWWSLGFVLTAAVCDLVSSHLIKESIFRLRPCHDPSLVYDIIVRAKYCPNSSSFTSSHATTHFGLSMYIFQTFKLLSKWWALIFTWAFMISYAQVYVGVHFPIDVISGAICGCILGTIMAYVYRKQIGLIIFGTQQNL